MRRGTVLSFMRNHACNGADHFAEALSRSLAVDVSNSLVWIDLASNPLSGPSVRLLLESASLVNARRFAESAPALQVNVTDPLHESPPRRFWCWLLSFLDPEPKR